MSDHSLVLLDAFLAGLNFANMVTGVILKRWVGMSLSAFGFAVAGGAVLYAMAGGPA